MRAHGPIAALVALATAAAASAATPNDPQLTSQAHLARIAAAGGWDVQHDAPGVVIGVVDAGVQLDHPDLADDIWRNAAESGDGREVNGIDDDGNGFVDDVHGWDFVGNDNDPSPHHSHGTHVAGLIGALGNNGIGVTGVAWQVWLMPVAVLDDDNKGISTRTAMGMRYAAANGAQIVNTSISSEGLSPSEERVVTDYPNVLFVTSAGNEGSDNDAVPRSPCSLPEDNIVCVANTTNADALNSTSDFGATSVDLAAPGTDVLSTIPGSGYGRKTGTSMSTAIVAGAAALVYAHERWADPASVKRLLMATVDRIPALDGRVASGGRLNLATLLQNADDVEAPSVPALVTPLPGAFTNAVAPTVTWQPATDDKSGIGGYEVHVDASTQLVDAQATSVQLPPLAEGEHVASIRAVDRAGNQSGFASRTFTVDLTPPSAPRVVRPATATRVRPGTFVNWTGATDSAGPVDGYAVVFDGGAAVRVGGLTEAVAIPGLRDGLHTVTVTAIDRAQNMSASVLRRFRIDVRKPSLHPRRAAVRRAAAATGPIAIPCRASEPVTCAVSIRPSPSAAAVLHLGGASTGASGTGRGVLLAAPVRSALRTVRFRRSLVFLAVVTATDRAGNARTVRRSFLVRP